MEVSGGQWRSPEVGREHGEDLLQPLGPRPVAQLAVVEGHVVAGGRRGGHRAAVGLLLTPQPLDLCTSTLYTLSSSISIHTYLHTTFCSYTGVSICVSASRHTHLVMVRGGGVLQPRPPPPHRVLLPRLRLPPAGPRAPGGEAGEVLHQMVHGV